MNVELLRKKYKELVPGTTHEVLVPNLSEDLGMTISLTLRGKPATVKDILIARMEDRLAHMNRHDEFEPFARAILEMYKKVG